VAVGYLRRSTDRQEQSIPDQRKAIERYAAEHDLELARFFVDDAISGTSAVRRPAFQEMVGLAQQERRPFSYVIVYDVKRFGRLDNDEAGYYRHILRTHGVEVLYVGENFSGDATDDLLRPVKQWQAREESKDLAKVTIRGMLSRVESGYWNGGSPPFGYDLRYESPREDGGAFLFVLRFQADGSKLVLDESGKVVRTLARGERLQVSKRDRSRLVLSSPERVDLVRRIFTMSAVDRMGYRAIANVLNDEGVPSPRNAEWAHIYSGAWTASTIRSILTNPMYVGDLVGTAGARARSRWRRSHGCAEAPRSSRSAGNRRGR
jgi:DNA invertase Pin-like site-specific DNA recombinase